MPTAAEGVRTVCRHLRSLGVFGPTAYLAAVYGASEMPQGFCRLCAVWGGVYMLNGRALELELEEEGERGATRVRAIPGPRGQARALRPPRAQRRLEAAAPPAAASRRRRAAAGRRRAGDAGDGATSTAISRCICILDGALLAGVDGGDEAPPKPISLATLFPGRGGVADAPRTGSTVFALEQSSEAGVCPRGQWVLHLSAESRPGVSPASLLRPPLERLLAQQATAATARRAAAAAAAAAAKQEAGAAAATADAGGGRRRRPPVIVHRVVARDAHRVPRVAKAQRRRAGRRRGAREERIAATAAAAAAAAAEEEEEAARAREAAFPIARVLWGAFSELPIRSCFAGGGAEGERASCPSNLYPCDDLPVAVDCDAHVARAQRLFERICPGARFLPSAEEQEEEASAGADETGPGAGGKAEQGDWAGLMQSAGVWIRDGDRPAARRMRGSRYGHDRALYK